MEPRRLLTILRRRAPLLVVLVLVGILGGYLSSSRRTVYRSEAELYVGRPITTGTKPADVYGNELLASILAPLASNQQIAEAAVKASGLPGRSAASVSAATVGFALPGTSVIAVSVADSNPLVSEQLTEAVANAFAAQAAGLPPVLAATGTTSTSTSSTSVPAHPPSTTGPTASGRGVPTVRAAPAATGSTTTTTTDSGPTTNLPEVVSLLRPALLPTTPLPTDVHHDLLIGGLAGLAVGLVLVVLVDFLGLAARTPRQLEAQLGLEVLGVIPQSEALSDAADEAAAGRILRGASDG